MATLFISDLHLSPERPDKLRAVLQAFKRTRSTTFNALYILGDLFEAWIGDDDTTSPHREIVEALARYAATGKPLYLMHGNRDFLMGRGVRGPQRRETAARSLPHRPLRRENLIDAWRYPLYARHRLPSVPKTGARSALDSGVFAKTARGTGGHCE